jgi:tRNA nucleotidyltransferase (CCA-adding enzyme)
VVVGATPAELIDRGFRQVGKDFPVFLHPETQEEYALARTERKVAPGYKGFTFDTSASVTLEEDLKRRDLTINAMAEDAEGRVIDPYGGRADLEAGLLRHVSPAFAEDPVRILRVGRFAARFGFCVAEETRALMRAMVAGGEVEALVPERVWTELERALCEPRPRLFFEVLRDCAALEVLFPEIERLFGVPQPVLHHPEVDTGLHVLMVLDQAARLSTDPRVRFAALTHDLGKGLTPEEEWPRHLGHEARSAALIEALCTRYRAPADYRDLAVLVARYHTRCHQAERLRPGTLLETLEALDAFRRPERLESFLSACEADARGRTGLEDRAYPPADRLRAAFEAARAVDAGAIAQSGRSGEEIRQVLRQRRIEAIAKETIGVAP